MRTMIVVVIISAAVSASAETASLEQCLAEARQVAATCRTNMNVVVALSDDAVTRSFGPKSALPVKLRSQVLAAVAQRCPKVLPYMGVAEIETAKGAPKPGEADNYVTHFKAFWNSDGVHPMSTTISVGSSEVPSDHNAPIHQILDVRADSAVCDKE